MSVNWGAWAGSGMAAKAGVERMARLGFGAVDPYAGMAAIGSILAGLGSETVPQLLASVFYWDRSTPDFLIALQCTYTFSYFLVIF